MNDLSQGNGKVLPRANTASSDMNEDGTVSIHSQMSGQSVSADTTVGSITNNSNNASGNSLFNKNSETNGANGNGAATKIKLQNGGAPQSMKPLVLDTLSENSVMNCNIEWTHSDLKNFWEKVYPNQYDMYRLDGLHPKSLCSKICNDVLRTNINVNSSSANPNDRVLCFEVLNCLEQRFIDAGVVEVPTPKPNGNPGQMLYKRVKTADFNKMGAVLHKGYPGKDPGALEAWARGVVEECVARLSKNNR